MTHTHTLQLRSTRCVFLGYSNVHKGFKCLDIYSGRVYISRDVIFNENVFLFASLHSNAGTRYHSDIVLLPSNSFGDNDFANTTNAPALSILPIPNARVQL
jgi:hypothetical protein